MSRDPSTAGRQGTAAAVGALAAAERLGMVAGSALYSDIESFGSGDAGCVEAVRAYLSAWTRALHDAGYLAGAYGNPESAVRSQAAVYASPDRARLDAVWSADWDGAPVTTPWNGVLDEHWSAHQRIKQYRGDHDETHGGVRLNIDSNIVDAPVATVARADGVVCRTDAAAGVLHKLSDGTYRPASATPGVPAGRLPVCTTPFQTVPDTAHTRNGADANADGRRVIPAGSLVWTTCEVPGLTLGRAGYWLRLEAGEWISSPLTTKPRPYERHPAIPACS